MLQITLFYYFLLLFTFFFISQILFDFKKFFIFSEICWLLLFVLLLSLEIFNNTILIFINCFLIFIFTAIEALIFSCLLNLKINSSKDIKKINW